MIPIVLYKIAYALTALAGFVMAVLVTNQNWRDPFSRFYSFVNVGLLMWAVGRYFMLTAVTAEQALFAGQILYFGSIAIYIFFLHSILVFLEVAKKRRGILTGFYAVATILFLLNLSDFLFGTRYIIASVAPKLNFFYYEVPGDFYFLQLFTNIAIPIYAIVELIFGFKKFSEQQKRKQIIYLLASSLIGFVGGSTILALVYDIQFPPIGVPLVALQFGIITYAMVQHRLFSLKILLAKILVFALWIFILTRTIVGESVEEQLVSAGLLFITIIIGLLLIRSVEKEVAQREKLEELSKKLADANEELKKLDQAKSEFISIASHQLRAPLTVIKGYTSMILEGTMGAISQPVKEALEKTYISGEQLIKLIANMLDLSRIESGKIRYEFKATNFAEVIRGIVDEFKANAEKKGVSLIFENKASDVKQLSLDSDKIREMVINFIDNAIKYTADHTYVRVLLEQSKTGWIRFSVTDQGMGIKKEDIKKLFVKFNRTDEARVREPNGMGIGLYFVKRVAEDHGGKVGVKSDGLGKGSMFFVELPIK